ncbi:MAG: ATP-binding protein [Gemmatimonadetes bacterium]|nr:ATP-binding protein [Gemmatimonadota bacterium]
MFRRHLQNRIEESLQDTPVVFLRGPRQSGKTTLVRSMSTEGTLGYYVTLDDAAVLNSALADPDGFVASLPQRAVIDEVQRAPELFRAIKASVDRDRTPGRLLLTGSANALALPMAADSLAGRMEIFTLWPLSQGELSAVRETFVDSVFASTWTRPDVTGEPWTALVERMLRGGYAEVVARKSETRRSDWFAAYVTTILERDIRDIANVHGLRDLPLLLRLAATRAGSLLNLGDISRDAGTAHSTLRRYWALLETVFLVRTVPAWAGSPSARLVKAPKVFLGDTGLLCHLLGLSADRLSGGDLMAGAVLENLVAMELIKQAEWSATRPAILHYRTHTQDEVDFLLENRRGDVVGIEVKKTVSPGEGDFRGLRAVQAKLGKRFLRGILLYGGNQCLSFGEDLWAVPIPAIWS